MKYKFNTEMQVEILRKKSVDVCKALKVKLNCSIAVKLPEEFPLKNLFPVHVIELDKRLNGLLEELERYDIELVEPKFDMLTELVKISSRPCLVLKFDFIIGFNADYIKEVENILRKHKVEFKKSK